MKTGPRVRQAWCKPCFRRWAKEHYKANKELHRRKNARARQRKKDYVLELRKQPCTDCQIQYPFYMMEFDHVGSKRKAIGAMCSHSWRILRAELAKCEVVCANCHSARTWKRRKSIPRKPSF